MWPWRRKIWLIATVLGVAATVALIWGYVRQSAVPDRVYRIAFGNYRPFHFPDDNGVPSGLAVDIVREAAARRGIRLEWVFIPDSPDATFLRGQVDLWPLLTMRPQRRGVVYISEPYFAAERCLIVRKDSTFRRLTDLAGHIICHDGSPSAARIIRAIAPAVRLTTLVAPRAMLEAVCHSGADAAFLDIDAASASLLDGIDCGGQRLRVIRTPELDGLFGVASTFRYSAVADSIRAGIGALADSGELTAIFARWNYFSPHRLEATAALIQSKRHEARLIAALCGAAALVLLAFWLAFRLRRERNTARLSEASFRLLFEQAPAGIFRFDARLVLTECNDRFCAILKAPRDRLIGLDLRGLRDQRILPAFKQALKGEYGEYVGEYTATHGPVSAWVQMVAAPLFERRVVVGGIGIVADISSQLRTETALRESERRYREMLETVQMVAVRMDLAANVTFCNDYTLAITGWTREEIIGRPVAELLPAEYREASADRIAHALATGEPPAMLERPILAKDGKWRWIQWHFGLLRDEQGNVSGFAALGVDVTDYRILHEQYRQAQKLETVGRLAGGVAHDFNNLLTVINGYSNLLLAKLPEADPIRAQVDQIHSAGERAARLTGQLLAFSRKQIIQPKRLELRAVLEESAEMLRRLIGEDVELVIKPASWGLVLADAGQVVQILMNLAVNARDAMPDGGKLTIETADVDLDAHYVARHPEVTPGPYVSLVVRDTGTGMTEDTCEHLFEPFFTTKDVGKGTGLGLSTVYGIVRQSNGSISVLSAPGKGTEFRIYLPRVDGGVPPDGTSSSPSGTLKGLGTVLVVEDQAGVREFAKQALASMGYHVMEAANGEDALRIAAEYRGRIHLLFTDIVLPGMNSRELADHFQELYPNSKILFTSGYADAVAVNIGTLKPGAAFLSKPYAPARLVEKVAALLGMPEAGAALSETGQHRAEGLGN